MLNEADGNIPFDFDSDHFPVSSILNFYLVALVSLSQGKTLKGQTLLK